jgi:hypothetical protein
MKLAKLAWIPAAAALLAVALCGCASAPPPGIERFDAFAARTGIDQGKLVLYLAAFGDSGAAILSKRLVNGRDTIEGREGDEPFIMKYVQEKGGRVFVVPYSALAEVPDKEAYLSVLLQYMHFMSASTVDFRAAFAAMMSMAARMKEELGSAFPDWVESGLGLVGPDLETYRKSTVVEDAYVLALK